jgi:hypothetical protein
MMSVSGPLADILFVAQSVRVRGKAGMVAMQTAISF